MKIDFNSLSLRLTAVFACCLIAPTYFPAHAADKPAESLKTREVKVKDITLSVPESWEQQKPKNKLRLAQFAVPPAEGSDKPVELTIFSFGGSSIDANITRWIKQFDSKGRQAKITRGESPLGAYFFVDLTGTFNEPIGPPILRKTRKLPDARMLGVILLVEKKGVYFLKLAGENKTVSAAAKALRASFGAVAEKEEPYEEESRE